MKENEIDTSYMRIPIEMNVQDLDVVAPVVDILQRLSKYIPPDKMSSYQRALVGKYRFITNINDITEGAYIRWLAPMDANEEKIHLSRGGFVCRVDVNAQTVRCCGAYTCSSFYSISVENIDALFQKLTADEQVIQRAIQDLL